MAADPDTGASVPEGPPPAWLPLADEETVRWRGGPRIQAAIPQVAVGLLAVLGGLGGIWLSLGAAGLTPILPALSAVAVMSGVALTVWSVLDVEYTAYVVTDRHLYRKSGILGRRVTTVGFETVQNVSYSQGITGTLFDYGTVSVDTAGGSGTELAFSDVDDPRSVQRLVGQQRDRLGFEDRSFGDPSGERRRFPGSPGQWAAVRDEVVALRRALDDRGR